MLASIDVGSNTVRMLIGDRKRQQVVSGTYYRRMTRLGGNYIPGQGLATASMDRTLTALCDFAAILRQSGAKKWRAVGTAALRRAENQANFIARVRQETGLLLEVIDGEEEARLTARGALSVIRPSPQRALILDIGGGSTELVLTEAGRTLFQHSYPLGVVRLCEEPVDNRQRQAWIEEFPISFSRDISQQGLTDKLKADIQLIGTAGTLTTLAAMAQELDVYDWRKINNTSLSIDWLQETASRLESLSITEREQLPGMEKGRGDLILPGVQLLLALMHSLNQRILKIADFGLLEGTLLELPCG